MDEVDGYRRRNRGGRIASDGDQAGPNQHAQLGAPVVFNCGRQAERIASARVEGAREVGIPDVVSAYAGIINVVARGIEGQNPALGQAVFPCRVNEK